MALSKIQSESINLADDFTFTGTVAGAGEPSDYVLLATTNITSSTASVSFDGYYSATYKNYKILISNLSPVSTTPIRFRFRRSNADVTVSNYFGHVINAYYRQGIGYGVASSGQEWGASSGQLSVANVSGTGVQTAQSEITIYDPLSTSFNKHISYITNFYSDEGYVSNIFGNYFLNDNSNAHSGITFFATSGNIVNGNFKLYGIK